jgi:hypothetical protein
VSLNIAILLVVAIIAANLPFVPKQLHFGIRFLSVILLYFAVGGLAYFLESRMGSVQHQHWEFYAVTACLFLVFAFPGFLYRYLWKHK